MSMEDGTPNGAWVAVLLPPGVSVQAGNRIEFARRSFRHVQTCHYIPDLVSRVL
jgi:hypothetical protein